MVVRCTVAAEEITEAVAGGSGEASELEQVLASGGREATDELVGTSKNLDEIGTLKPESLEEDATSNSGAAPKTGAAQSVTDQATQIGQDVGKLPRGSGKPNVLANRLTDLRLPHDDAVNAEGRSLPPGQRSEKWEELRLRSVAAL